MILVERYATAPVTIRHPGLQSERTIDLSTSHEANMYNFCRLHKIDILIIVKPETSKKAFALFDGLDIKVVDTFDIDRIKALAVRSQLGGISDYVTFEELMDKHVNYGPDTLRNELVRRALEHSVANPQGELAQVIEMTDGLRSYDEYGKIPVFLRDLASEGGFDTTNFVLAIKATTAAIYEDMRKEYPMAFVDEVEDGEDLENYIYYMDKLRELGLLISQQVAEDVKEVEIPVVDNDIPF
ncbi:hypothetical protein D3C76_1012850 [compost metagenome]